MDEARKSQEKGKRKNKTMASRTQKLHSPSTSSSSDVREIPPPIKIGLTASGHSASTSGEKGPGTPEKPLRFLPLQESVSQNQIPKVGRVIAPYAVEILDNMSLSVSKLTSKKWAVSSSVDPYTLSVAAKQQVAGEDWKAKLAVEEEKWDTKYCRCIGITKLKLSKKSRSQTISTPIHQVNNFQEDICKKDLLIKDLQVEHDKEKKLAESLITQHGHLSLLLKGHVVTVIVDRKPLIDYKIKSTGVQQTLIDEADRENVTRRVLAMKYNTYIKEFPLSNDSDNDEETSVEVSSSQEFAKAKVSSSEVKEDHVRDVAEPNPDPEEPTNVPALIDSVAPSPTQDQ
uniref:Uncharacterized protein n=1 Tax=Cannabis sativa TaxID=3483 RepID=A0A803PCT7_CANSA